jgi:hypothetical protein
MPCSLQSKTNPISGETRTPSFQRPNPMPIAQNEANSPVPTTRRHWRAGRLCETKPIGGGPGATVRNEPNFGGSFKFEVSSVKRNVRNEPNSAGATRRASPLWRKSYDESDLLGASTKQSQFPAAPGGARPGDGGRGVWYKQSQFAPDGPGRPSPRPPALTLPPTGRQRRQTKPIPGSAGWDGARGMRGDRAKRSQFPAADCVTGLLPGGSLNWARWGCVQGQTTGLLSARRRGGRRP